MLLVTACLCDYSQKDCLFTSSTVSLCPCDMFECLFVVNFSPDANEEI